MNQSTGYFGKPKLTRAASSNKSKNSVLVKNGLNLITQKSYNDPSKRDPYTGARYDFTDFDDVDGNSKSKLTSSIANIPTAAASPPTINSVEAKDIISKVTNNHSKVLQLLKNRKSQLWNLQQYWTGGSTMKTLKYLYQCNDTSK